MRYEVIEKLLVLITTAFGLVAALAWNDAIKSLFAENGLLHSLATYGPWLYAIFVTIVAVGVTIWISKISVKMKNADAED